MLRFVPYAVNRTAQDLGRVHGTDERVSVDSFRQALCTYSRLLRLFGSVDGGSSGR